MSSAPDGDRLRAIVVDDSRAMRTILRRILLDIGFSAVLEAEHGRRALEELEGAGEPPALALIDWNMPEMGGLELIAALREQRRYDRTRLMMVTSETNPRHVMDALRAGVDEYAMKPITREVIEDKLSVMGLLAGASW